MISFSLLFWLWCAFYNRTLKKHIIPLSEYTSRLADKRIHIKLVSSVCDLWSQHCVPLWSGVLLTKFGGQRVFLSNLTSGWAQMTPALPLTPAVHFAMVRVSSVGIILSYLTYYLFSLESIVLTWMHTHKRSCYAAISLINLSIQ